METFIQFFR